MRRMLLESAEALGARHIKVGDFFDSPVGMPRLIENSRGLCREAAEHGTRIAFELMPFSVIDKLEDALELVAGRRAAERRALHRPLARGQARHSLRARRGDPASST